MNDSDNSNGSSPDAASMKSPNSSHIRVPQLPFSGFAGDSSFGSSNGQPVPASMRSFTGGDKDDPRSSSPDQLTVRSPGGVQQKMAFDIATLSSRDNEDGIDDGDDDDKADLVVTA